MASAEELVRRRPVPAFYFLTFSISWGLLLLVGGRDLVSGVDWETSSAFTLAILGMLTGPAIASLVLIALLSGRAGLRELLGRLLRWQVSARWYAVALLTAPLVATPVLLGLSLVSSAFRPVILTEEFTAAALLSAVGIGFTTLLEELGWTGFAIPRLRLRYSVFATGLIVGVPWGVWHLLQIIWVGRSTSEGGAPGPLPNAVCGLWRGRAHGLSRAHGAGLMVGSTTALEACSWRRSCTRATRPARYGSISSFRS